MSLKFIACEIANYYRIRNIHILDKISDSFDVNSVHRWFILHTHKTVFNDSFSLEQLTCARAQDLRVKNTDGYYTMARNN